MRLRQELVLGKHSGMCHKTHKKEKTNFALQAQMNERSGAGLSQVFMKNKKKAYWE